LINVGSIFLAKIDFKKDELRRSIAEYMAKIHLSIGEANAIILKQEKRHNHSIPTSYFKLINFHK